MSGDVEEWVTKSSGMGHPWQQHVTRRATPHLASNVNCQAVAPVLCRLVGTIDGELWARANLSEQLISEAHASQVHKVLVQYKAWQPS
jgi:hypothetical protein